MFEASTSLRRLVIDWVLDPTPSGLLGSKKDRTGYAGKSGQKEGWFGRRQRDLEAETAFGALGMKVAACFEMDEREVRTIVVAALGWKVRAIQEGQGHW